MARITNFKYEKRLVVFVSFYDKDELVSERLLCTQYVHSDKELNFMIEFYKKNYHNIERTYDVEFVKGCGFVPKILKGVLTIKTFDTL